MGWLTLELTNSAWLVSVVAFYRSIPLFLFGFLAGPIIDRLGRRQAIVVATTLDLTTFSAIGMLLWLDRVELWHLYIIAFVIGSVWAVSWPARRGVLPDLVGKERTVDVLLVERFGQGAAKIVAPALAGVLVAVYGTLGCFMVIVLVQLVNLYAVWSVQKQETVTSTPDKHPSDAATLSFIQQITEGFTYVRREPLMLGIILTTVTMNLFVMPYTTLLPVFARDVLNQDSVGLGWLSASLGIGTYVGLLMLNVWRQAQGRYTNHGSIFLIGTAFMGFAIMAFALSPIFWLSWLALAAAAMGQNCFALMQNSIIMLSTDDEMRNRMMGIVVICIGMGPFGKLFVGALAEAYGAPFAVASTSITGLLLLSLIAINTPKLRRV